MAALQERCVKVTERLEQTYPDAHCELVFSNPLELLVATILSAQCTDLQVNKVTQDLFATYHSPSDYADAPPDDLAQAIRRIGLYRNKAKNIQAACRLILDRHAGQVPSDMDALTALPGVGRKTANVVLGNAFGINVGVVVDTHVARLSQRLRLTSEKDPTRIEAALMKLVPSDKWTLFSHWLIWHGRRCCRARNPGCPTCPLRDLCPSADKA
jgi:endonuclease III